MKKRDDLSAAGIAPYGGKFEVSHAIQDILTDFQADQEVIIAGRIMAQRSHGKVLFADLEDQSGRIQLFIKLEDPEAPLTKIIKALDIGDIVGVRGSTFTTRMGQDSIKVVEVTFLTKSMMTLPEKWHGLKDVEVRYRQRYIDLIANKDVRDVFMKRSQIVSYIRRLLDGRK
ncbi:MAG: lysine--tRNA ligase, partial [Candidatus Omnitrophica bacterium]|nr:lysine--tRNA ligase [Candidatus Omnitrophota bacterium]